MSETHTQWRVWWIVPDGRMYERVHADPRGAVALLMRLQDESTALGWQKEEVERLVLPGSVTPGGRPLGLHPSREGEIVHG